MNKNPIPEEWYKLGPFTVFDIETTGMSPVYHRIIEIAGVRVDTNGEISKFSSLINPKSIISDKVSSIHGITNEMVENSPTFYEIGNSFMTFSKGSTLAAHNARFDLSFLQESLVREGIGVWEGKTLDTIPLIKQAYPGLQSYSLQKLRYTFGLNNKKGAAHRALNDAEWTFEIFEMTMKRLLILTSQIN